MRDVCVNLFRAVFDKDLSRLTKRTCRINDVVNDDTDTVLHVSDNSHLGHFARLAAAFVDDR